MYRRIPRHFQENEAKNALEALDGFGMSILTNRDNDTFWYAQEGLKTRYKHEKAKVGDKFWDGNNGDRHTVVAVDLDNSRLAFRNDDQNHELVEIAGW